MRLCRFSASLEVRPTARDGEPGVSYGVPERDGVRELAGDPFRGLNPTDRVRGWSHVRLLPPCCPTKIVCLGRNYVDHAREHGHEPPRQPVIFFKPPSALVAAEDPVWYPEWDHDIHYEGELGVVIGKRCFRIGSHAVGDYILGYTCVNDVSARQAQRGDLQWTRGKGFDTSCPVGPVLTDEVDPAQLTVSTFLNGELRQCAPVSDLIFSIETVIRYIADIMTLEPGDLISTGTPAGVGPMQVGDTVVVSIGGIGELKNTIVKDPAFAGA